ncbi:MAG: cyclic GMP-AMP synthase DncV-like nucleotidyltransferase [Paraglaciecola sp.]|uniref:SMODS domain-containing nucleotidyltransferase n=3 Tax=Paraglaciecola sp. TaxID=1920173 RepID=UPI003265A319
MKLVKHFNEFLKNEVNLNQHRIDTLESRVQVVTNFIKGSDSFKSAFIEAIPQGSYAHRTIIKPTAKKKVFDADVVVYLKPIDGWEAKDYIEQIYKTFNASKHYQGKVSRQTRCVKLNYAGEFHIDIVPCIRSKFLFTETENVCNRLTNEFESCSSIEFSKWVRKKNAVAGNNNLIKAIRLCKYLRDFKQTFSVKSILLTTLLASRITLSEELFGTDSFKDLPMALKTLFNRLDEWLDEQDEMPIVNNPVDDDENFNRHWDEDKFQNFKKQVKKYNGWINTAYHEMDKEESIKGWRKVFGDKFAPEATAKAVEKQKSLPSHCERLRWPMANSPQKLNVKAVLQKDKSSVSIGDLAAYNTIPKHHWIRFNVKDTLDHQTSIFWQVVNTGSEAANDDCLRGKFFQGSTIHKESTLYRGTHWVEAVAVRQGVCIARSGPIVVKIA